jgi:hypothetical protein
MNQYIITEELLQEAMENTTWGRTNQQKFRDKLTPYQSERDEVLDDVKDAIDEFMLLNAKGHASLHHGLWGVIEKVRQRAGEQ